MRIYDVLMGTFTRWGIDTHDDIGVADARMLETVLDLWCAPQTDTPHWPESRVEQPQENGTIRIHVMPSDGPSFYLDYPPGRQEAIRVAIKDGTP